jgi:hypothetical protein
MKKNESPYFSFTLTYEKITLANIVSQNVKGIAVGKNRTLRTNRKL